MVSLPDGTASTIHSALLNFMSKHMLDIEKMVGLGSDGASVMVGCRNGVSKFLI